MKSKYKRLLIIITIMVIVLGIVLVMFLKKPLKKEENIIKVLDVIKGFPYELKENDSKLEKSLFYELEKVLKKEAIDYKKYAELLAKLYIADTFSLEMKLNKYDIGGLEYILESERDKYKNILSDTLYDSVENNYDGKRTQELPLVTDINLLDCVETENSFDKEQLLAYDISLEWSYEKDLGYDNKALVKVAKFNDLIYVISYEPIK